MDKSALFALAADAVLILHTMFVAFIVFGLLLIYIGRVRGWYWVRNPWFRVAHLTAIGVVVIQSWMGILCPLTTWEMGLRSQAGDATYSGSFLSHWLEIILYYEAPTWVFLVCYTGFAAVVVASWYWVHPRPFKTRRRDASKRLD